MSKNFDVENEPNMDEELEMLHKELMDVDPNYKNSPSFQETEDLIKTKKLTKNGRILIDRIGQVLDKIRKHPESINKKELKSYKRELTTYCFQLKKIYPEVGGMLDSSSSELETLVSVHHLKAKLQINTLDEILG